jgi:hypothetical protein
MEGRRKANSGHTRGIRNSLKTRRKRIWREIVSLANGMTVGADFLGISCAFAGIARFFGAYSFGYIRG